MPVLFTFCYNFRRIKESYTTFVIKGAAGRDGETLPDAGLGVASEQMKADHDLRVLPEHLHLFSFTKAPANQLAALS